MLPEHIYRGMYKAYAPFVSFTEMRYRIRCCMRRFMYMSCIIQTSATYIVLSLIARTA